VAQSHKSVNKINKTAGQALWAVVSTRVVQEDCGNGSNEEIGNDQRQWHIGAAGESAAALLNKGPDVHDYGAAKRCAHFFGSACANS
jgi:hypothetical protein